MKYDFSGRAASVNVRCTDGTIFHSGSLDCNNNKTVPLVWMHQHQSPMVVGKALVKIDSDGNADVYGSFNNTQLGQDCKEMVLHGDVTQLSVWAKTPNRRGNDLYSGIIQEVSLVLSGADHTALITPGSGQQFAVAHSDIDEDGNEIDEIEIIAGSVIDGNGGELEEVEHSDEKGDPNMNEDKNEKKEQPTVQEVYDSMTDLQKAAVEQLLDAAIEQTKEAEKKEGASDVKHEDEDDADDSSVTHEDEGVNNMKENVFDGATKTTPNGYIAHADQSEILDRAKDCGSFKKAMNEYLEDAGVAHADTASAVGGFDDTDKVFDGRTSLNLMFPEYSEAYPSATPQLLTNDQGWVTKVLAKVRKSPLPRVRTSYVDIRKADTLKAKGYVKGNKKKVTGNFKLARRTTDPQTVYVKNALHRDDIVDIQDFDYVKYLYDIDRLELNETLACAIMIGDDREEGAEDKIEEQHIRPIWTDDELFTKHVTVDIDAMRAELQGSDTSKHFGDNYVYAEAIIDTLLHAREKDFFGTGTSDFYCAPSLMNKMLLARDYNGRRIYQTKSDLQSALNIGEFITAEQFEGKVRTASNGKKYKLLGILGNLADYQVGSAKGGEITHFQQFDIDFNQEKSLIETRLSGAITRLYSFIVLEMEVKDESAEG